MFSEIQAEVAQLLVQKPLDLKQIREKTGYSEQALEKELILMIKLGVVKKNGEKYELIPLVVDKLKERLKGWENAFRARIMLEAHGATKQQVEEDVERVVKEFEANKAVKIVDKTIEEATEYQKTYSALVELVVATKTFRDMLDVVSRYGASSIELLNPRQFTLTMDQAQAILLDTANVVVGYENVLRALQSQKKAKKASRKAK